MAGRWGPVQVRASGLLGLLQLKDRGQNPNELVGDIVPTIDMLPWWLRGEMESLPELTGPIPGANGTWQLYNPVAWRTPINEWWYINMGLQGICGANNNQYAYWRIVQSYTFGGSAAPYWVSGPPSSFADTAGTLHVTLGVQGVWMPPDSTLELSHSFDAADDVYARITLTRAKV